MRKRRELAAASSVRRISRSMVSAMGGKVCASAVRSKTDLGRVESAFWTCMSTSKGNEERVTATCKRNAAAKPYTIDAMRVLSAAEMQICDRVTTERFGVPSLKLMRTAATAVATFVREQFPQAK